jgi:hypothetical protein
MAPVNTAIAPYFDTYDENKKFYRILFRPGYAVQARELTQLQTILQKQVERFGKHIFEEGAMVIPGQASQDLRYAYVIVNNTDDNTIGDINWRVNTLYGNYLVGATSGAKAQVVNSLPETDSNGKITLFVKYVSGGTSGTNPLFLLGEGVSAQDPGGVPLGMTTQPSVSGSTPCVGVGAAATIKRGVYFVRNTFVLVDDQVIILDPYNADVSARVGFNIIETIVKTEDDPDELNDNAQGSPNFAAPGAHRFKIELILVQKELGTIGTDAERDFIELIRLENGQVKLKVTTTDYSELEKTLARRTYDESGDYTVRPFFTNIIPHETDNTKLYVDIDPGKAYVRGFEIETISKQRLELNKARTTSVQNNATIRSRFGNYVLIDNVHKLPDIKTYAKVELRDGRNAVTPGVGPAPASAAGNIIGYARCRSLDYYSGNPGNTDAIYKLSLFDIKMNDGKTLEQVRSIHDSGASLFNCNINLSTALMEGSITVTGNTAVTGNGTTWVSRQSQVLKAGDWIYIPVNDEYAKIASVASDQSLTFASPGVTNVSGAGYTFAFAELFDSNNQELVFDMPNSWIKDITDDTNYTVYRRFTGISANGSGVVTLTAGADEEFTSLAPTDYIVSINGTGDVVHPITINITSGGTQVDLSGTGIAASAAVTVIAPVRKIQATASAPKPKYLRTADVTASGAIDTGSATDLRSISLNKADILKIVKIVMAPNFLTAPDELIHPDIKDRYDLDNGQRDTHYDLGRINLKPGAAPATGRLLVQFQWFEHDAVNGNFFSVDSYPVPYEDIPQYISKETSDVYELRDCLDFRPRIDDTGLNFIVGSGASLTEMPRGDVTADYEYYLARRDKLFLTSRGQFVIKEGTPSIQPAPADTLADSMMLYELNLLPYTAAPDHVTKRFIENRRYTMRDIGKLEQRIEKLEYYTSLSLLEKETANLEIKDGDGNDRFKNGFIVDPFNGHGIGDVVSTDYRCSIDMNSGECRPTFNSDNINLIFDSLYNTVGDYSENGPLFALPRDPDVIAIEQPKATSSININPYAIATFIGSVTLDPPNDEWKDTETLPTPTQIDLPGDFDAVQAAVEGVGTVWGEWEEHWTGTPTETGREIINQDWIIPGGGKGHTVDTFGNPIRRDENGKVLKNRRKDKKTGKWEWYTPKSRPDSLLRQTRVTTTQTGSSTRTGVRLKATPRTVTVDGGSRVVNVAYIPFMRQRFVTFKAKSMKPTTRLYPFFDGVDISAHCHPVAIGGPYTFVPANLAQPIVTDATGKAEGIFRIPAATFQTGERTFRLIDRTDNDRKKAATFGESVFRAQGLLETRQNTIISTRVADITREVVDDEKVISRSDTSDLVEVLKDPLAQSFQVTDEGGIFLTKVVVYFETKDKNLPVTLQIREIVNGYPGPRILPFGNLVKDAADVHTNEITNGVLYIDGISQPSITDSESKPLFQGTEFEFEAPVYLQQGVQYSFVLLTDSNAYNVWIAKSGGDGQAPENMVGTDIPIQANPYIGVMFKSQNASTWTPDQTADIKFELHKAQFKSSGEMVFVNDSVPLRALAGDPLEFKDGSSFVRVHHRNHGMRLGGVTPTKVTISGVQGTSGLLFNVPLANLNKTHDVVFCDLDSYIINTGSNATLTSVPYAFGGGASVLASEDRQMDNVHPIITQILLPDTNVNYSLLTTTSRGVHGTIDSPYKLDTTQWIDIFPNDTIEFAKPKMVCSEVNELNTLRIDNGPSSPSDHKSCRLRAVMSTNNPNISPIIDIARLSLISIGSRLDDPSHEGANSVNHSVFDQHSLASGNTNISFDAATLDLVSTHGATALALSQAAIGKYLTISGAANSANNGTFRIVSVSYNASAPEVRIKLDNSAMVTAAAGAATTVIQLHRFISELAPMGGSASAKYITKRIVLAAPATALQMLTGVYRPTTGNVKFYYKLLRADDNSIFDNLPWVEAPLDISVSPATDASDYREYSCTVGNLADYVSLACKVVMVGSDPSNVSRLRDFRGISLAV